MLVIRVAVAIEAIPDRERHTEVALAADAPIELQPLGPFPVAHFHEVRMPLDLVALREQSLLLVE